MAQLSASAWLALLLSASCLGLVQGGGESSQQRIRREQVFLNDTLSHEALTVTQQHMANESMARSLRACRLTGNPIDDCWRCDRNWARNRKRLADCGVGFGRNAVGGKYGRFYVVTDSGDDNPVSPKPGTLRHAVIQAEPLWITFRGDMLIQLKEELLINSHKTIDGRGADVHIANGPCLTLQYVTNVIVHGVKVYNCRAAGNAMVRDSPYHFGWRTRSDGDGISIFGGTHIWVDHVYLANCQDGLVDAVMASTAITISNCYFTNHDKVMLLGHSDDHPADKIMQVTVALNHFGTGLVQRMPRCRYGQFHVVNNDYSKWEMYAVGGSANPTINSEGNRYMAPDGANSKEITKRDVVDVNWGGWNWRSTGDLLLNGAFFVPSGSKSAAHNRYTYWKATSMRAKPASMVGIITAQAGPIYCRANLPC